MLTSSFVEENKMNDNENFVMKLNEFLEQKGLTQEEALEYLKEVFIKAFIKDRDALSKYEEEEPEHADVNVDINMETGEVKIERRMVVVDEITIIGRFRQIELDDPRLEGTDLKVGETFVEYIDLNNINLGKRQHIKQLFLQKLSEAEKIKIYKRFSKFKGELLNARIHKVLNKGNVILDYDGDSIFMPAAEISSLDKDRIIENRPLTIYVLEIEELSKDAQIIASRKNPQFVAKLIEREIDDVSDGVVKIESIAREAGFKTKVAVSTDVHEVDPVGSIIGVKGQKIRPIVDEIGGERLDVIKYSPNIKQFIAEALLPAEITGINYHENEEGMRIAIVVVEEDQFLPALGKRGINIKLAAILTKTRIDVKTVAEAKAEGIEYELISKSKFVAHSQDEFISDIGFEEFSSIEDIADVESTINEDDYGIEEDFSENEEEDFDDYADFNDDEEQQY